MGLQFPIGLKIGKKLSSLLFLFYSPGKNVRKFTLNVVIFGMVILWAKSHNKENETYP